MENGKQFLDLKPQIITTELFIFLKSVLNLLQIIFPNPNSMSFIYPTSLTQSVVQVMLHYTK